MTLVVTLDEFQNVPTAGNSDGYQITSAAGEVPLMPVERSSSSISQPRKIGVRTSSGTITGQTVTCSSDLVELALDDAGAPGTWIGPGNTLTLGSVGTGNVLFWVRCYGASGDNFGLDNSIFLTVDSVQIWIRRNIVQRLAVLGSGADLYLGFDWGGGTTWSHSTSAGDIDVQTADGGSFLDVVYPSASTEGAVTTMGEVTLESGLTLVTKYEKIGEGIYLVSHTLTSTTNRWAAVKRNVLDHGGGSTVDGTCDVTSLLGASEAIDCTGMPFVAASAWNNTLDNVTAEGVHVALIAGNGYDNDWCNFQFDYTSDTNWYNQDIVSRNVHYAQLLYGYLANGSSTDFTVQLLAGIPTTVSYVISSFVPLTQGEFNEAVYSSYFYAYYDGTQRLLASFNRVERMLWATSHQLKRLKRHILVEGSKVMVIQPSHAYAAVISIGDIIFQALALGEVNTLTATLDLLHSLGPPDGAAANSNLAGSAGNNLNGDNAVWLPFLELWATYFGYIPDPTAEAQFLAIADSYADAINNVKLIPDGTTNLAHYYSDLFAGPESMGFGDFSEPFTFLQAGNTINRWQGLSGTCTRVNATGGVTPHSGSWMAECVSEGGSAGLFLMPITVPPSKTVTVTAWVNIPVAIGTGARIMVQETSSDGGTVEATTYSSYLAVTSGWQQLSVPVAMTSSTGRLNIALQTVGANGDTAYFDDVQVTMASPPYPGIFWNVNIMPPQILGNMLTPSVWSMVWVQLNLLCLRQLLGAGWTTEHEDALVAVNDTFPAAFWTSGVGSTIKEDLYHWIRSTWLSSWGLFGHFIWYIVSGEKILTDAAVAGLYAAHPAKAAGLSVGNVFYEGWVCNADGSAISGSDFSDTFIPGWPSTAFYYVNGGGWLWASDGFFHQSAIWASVVGAEANRLNRLWAEIASTSYHAHESINSSTGVVAEPSMDGYGTNIIMGAVTTLERPPAGGFLSLIRLLG